MGRLTFDGLFCDIAKCKETPGGTFCENGSCSQRKVWERLKEYEDTGLEPEEIVGLQKQKDLLAQYGAQKFSASMEDFREINSLKLKIQSLEMSLSVACDGLNKYTQAEQEGRFVVLDEETALAMCAGARAIEQSKRFWGATYCWDVFGKCGGPKELSYYEAANKLRCLAERALEGGSDHA